MYEVEIRVYDTRPRIKLEDFLEQTKNFGKKFYHIDKSLRTKPHLKITALAVSRDVSYILRWKIQCKQLLTKEQEDDGVMIEDMFDETFQPWGLDPSNWESNRCYFPQQDEGVRNYKNTFSIHGFIQVQKLMKDGVSIV